MALSSPDFQEFHHQWWRKLAFTGASSWQEVLKMQEAVV